MEKSLLFHFRRIGVEFIIFSVYAVFSISWAATGSLMPLISNDLALNAQQATLITSMIVVAKIFGASFTAFLVYKFGLKKGYFLGCILMSSGIFLSFVDSYSGILIIRFLTGLGSACALVCLVPIAQQWFEKKALHFVISFNMTSNLVGITLGLVLAESISNYFGNWRDSLSFYAWINLILLILWLFVGKDENKKEEKKNNAKDLIYALKSRVTWGMIIFYVGPILFLNSLFTFLPTFYAQYAGFSKELADFAKKEIPALANFAIIFGPYLGLFFKRKNISFKIMLLSGGACIFICGFCMLFLQNLVLMQIFAVLSGIFYSMWFPFFFNLPSELKNSNPNQTAYIMSAFWGITFVILSFNLWVVSWSVDKTHSFTLGFVYIFALIFISAILAQFVLPRRENFIQGEK
ncbi:MFS transporter [Campylobacter jejuni]|nr:MFS transporter [Campylobacter jejuni]